MIYLVVLNLKAPVSENPEEVAHTKLKDEVDDSQFHQFLPFQPRGHQSMKKMEVMLLIYRRTGSNVLSLFIQYMLFLRGGNM